MRKTIPRWWATSLLLAKVFLSHASVSTALADQTDSTTQPQVAPAISGFDSNLTGGWSGERQRLQEAGIAVGATLTLEGFSNLQGGIDTAHLVGATTFDLNLALDTEKIFHLHGGEFYIDIEDHAFRNPSTALVGDLQVFDKQNASPYLEIFELWYQQKLFDDKIRVKIGKVDANSEFVLVDNGLAFINSSSQLSPTIFLLPTTPDPMPSLNVFFTPNENYFASFGAYYANRSDRFGELVDDTSKVQPAAFWDVFDRRNRVEMASCADPRAAG